MKKSNRRTLLKGVTLGAGSLAFSPFIRQLKADQAGEAPKRFVFVVKSSGLQGEYLNPKGLSHGGDQIVDESLTDSELPESLTSLTPFKD